MTAAGKKIAVVVPSYRVRDRILGVLGRIGPEVSEIYVVDDACPEGTGEHVRANCRDPRVRVIVNPANLGVGGAVITGYRAAAASGADVIVKIDGDGQMDPGLLPFFVTPILGGEADYTKGNRFFNLEDVGSMPAVRVIGNAALSLITKVSSGYWTIFDPTNGYTAIHASLLPHLRLDKVNPRYFFESDLLFRLGLIRAKVEDVPMKAVYSGEPSSLKIRHAVLPFIFYNLRNSMKRFFYAYLLRDFSLASIQLVVGMVLVAGGGVFGVYEWIAKSRIHQFASTGTVMLAVLPILLGSGLLLSFINYDVQRVPGVAIHRKLPRLSGP